MYIVIVNILYFSPICTPAYTQVNIIIEIPHLYRETYLQYLEVIPKDVSGTCSVNQSAVMEAVAVAAVRAAADSAAVGTAVAMAVKAMAAAARVAVATEVVRTDVARAAW